MSYFITEYWGTGKIVEAKSREEAAEIVPDKTWWYVHPEEYKSWEDAMDAMHCLVCNYSIRIVLH